MTETRSIGEILRDAEAGRLENILAEDREPYDLIGAADRLFDLLESRKIPFVVVGGIAMLQYIEGRNTRDVDLIVDPSATSKAPELLVRSEDKDLARAEFEGVQLDLLKTSNEVFDLVRKDYSVPRSFGSRLVTCATPDGLFLLKCYALPSLYRQGEFSRADIYEGDLQALLRLFPIAEETAFEALAPHLPGSDIRAIREVVAEIHGRISKSRERGDQFGSSGGPAPGKDGLRRQD